MEKEQLDNFPYDSIINKTTEEFKKRAIYGFSKYGTNLDRTDKPDVFYLQMLKEELMDGILYINKYLDMQENKK